LAIGTPQPGIICSNLRSREHNRSFRITKFTNLCLNLLYNYIHTCFFWVDWFFYFIFLSTWL